MKTVIHWVPARSTADGQHGVELRCRRGGRARRHGVRPQPVEKSPTTGRVRTARSFSADRCALSPKTSKASAAGSSSAAGTPSPNWKNSSFETKADAIYCNRDPDPFGRTVEGDVEAMVQRHGATSHAEKDAALHERDELLSGTGNSYRVYSPYLRAWSKKEKPPVGPRVRKLAPPAKIASLPLPDLSHWGLQSEGARIIEPGEHAAPPAAAHVPIETRRRAGLRHTPQRARRRHEQPLLPGPSLGPALRAGNVPCGARGGRRERGGRAADTRRSSWPRSRGGTSTCRFCFTSPTCSGTTSIPARAACRGVGSAMTRRGLRAGARAGRDFPSSTPGCGSCPASGSCTTGCGSSRRCS